MTIIMNQIQIHFVHTYYLRDGVNHFNLIEDTDDQDWFRITAKSGEYIYMLY